jgi:hypothetical protein
MKICFTLLSAISILFSACVNSSKWTRGDIDKKLKEVFPGAKAIRVLDSVECKRMKSDTMNLPLPVYKALITEKDYSGYSFIFYFYNASLQDTSTFADVFRSAMIHDIVAGLGTKKVEYVYGVPQFDKTGDKLIVYAALFALPKSYDLSNRENAIRKVFNLQKTQLEDVRLSKP